MIRVKFKKSQPSKVRKRLRNRARIRKKLSGTKDIPRLSVFKSSKHIYVQLVDDVSQVTLLSSSSLKRPEKLKPLEIAKKIGEEVGQKAKEKKIKQIVFDRGGFIYHGRVKALAEGARSAGLKF